MLLYNINWSCDIYQLDRISDFITVQLNEMC